MSASPAKDAPVPPPWLDGVEGPAVEFITADESTIRVAAGPGTGKTFALMRRIARLLASGEDPTRILVLTFTRTAAGDLVSSLKDLGVPGVEDVWAGTLHSYCFGLLSREAVLEATGRHPRPLLKHEQRTMLEDLKHQHGFGIRESEKLLSAADSAWARLQTDEPGWPRTERERLFHRRMLEWLRFHKGMLVGEMVPLARSYLRNNPQAPEHDAFSHVLVDEYQDLNRADQDVIDILSQGQNLVVIGDEDQSIFTQLRYAQPDGIRDFARVRKGVLDVPFTACRRCPTGVVQIANHLIRNNPDRTPRELKPFPGNPDGRVSVLQWRSIEDEITGLVHLIGDAVDRGLVEPGKVLVLAPRRILGYPIRDGLKARGIQAHSYFREEALDDVRSQEAYTLLSLLADTDDRVALRTWLAFGHKSWAAAPYKHLHQHCHESGDSPREALDRVLAGDLSIPYSKHLVERYELLRSRENQALGTEGEELIDALFDEGVEELQQVRELAQELQVDAANPLTAAQLLEGLRIRIIQPELPEEGNFVRIMTLHKSKGLTADLVVVAGCVQGWVPSVDPKDEDVEEHTREGRRLFYVAITRPTQHLVVSHFATMPLDGAHKMRVRIRKKTRKRAYCIASQFIEELGPDAPVPTSARVGNTL